MNHTILIGLTDVRDAVGNAGAVVPALGAVALARSLHGARRDGRRDLRPLRPVHRRPREVHS